MVTGPERRCYRWAMPRSIVAAIACICLLGLVGLAGTAVAVADVAKNGIWSDRGIAAQLHLPGRAISALVSMTIPILLARALKGIAMRDPRTRGGAVVSGLVMSLVLGFLFGVLLLISVLERNTIGAVAVAVGIGVFVTPFAIVSYALSRPSAKAWFTPTALESDPET
jgi:hypothetical protein